MPNEPALDTTTHTSLYPAQPLSPARRLDRHVVLALTMSAAAGLALVSSVAHAEPWAQGRPADAMVMGSDGDGAPLFACRTPYLGSTQVGKTRADWGACDIGYGTTETFLGNYQTLVPEWAPAYNGAVPANATYLGAAEAPSGSNSLFGPLLYTCRASYGGALHPGKVRPGLGGCSIAWGGKEIIVTAYDVLVSPPFLKNVSSNHFPLSAVVGGHEADGTPLYLCMASFNGGLHPGKTRKGWNSCDVSWGGTEHWVSPYYVVVPDFEPAGNGNPYRAGVDTDGNPLGICNAYYYGSAQVGKFTKSNGLCSFGFGGTNVSVSGAQALALPPLLH